MIVRLSCATIRVISCFVSVYIHIFPSIHIAFTGAGNRSPFRWLASKNKISVFVFVIVICLSTIVVVRCYQS